MIPGTRGIGIPAALGLLIALAAVLFLLPPFLAVCGRGVFWPFVPRPGSTQRPGRGWRAFASRVVRRPVASLLAGLAVLAIMATGLFGHHRRARSGRKVPRAIRIGGGPR